MSSATPTIIVPKPIQSPLSLKDLTILYIGSHPSEVFRLPKDLIRRLYLGFHFSPIMQQILLCASCRKPRPCRLHDYKRACTALTLGGVRCSRTTMRTSRKYCRLHASVGQCRREGCRQRAVSAGVSLCWQHYREGKCIAIDFNNRWCRRLANPPSTGKCKHHQSEVFPEWQCRIPGCTYTIRSHPKPRGPWCHSCLRVHRYNNRQKEQDRIPCNQLCYNHREQRGWCLPDLQQRRRHENSTSRTIAQYLQLSRFEV